MNIPNLADGPLVKKDLNMDDQWFLMFSQLFTELQNNLSNTGFIVPSLSATQVADLDLTKNIGGIFYNNTLGKFQCNENGSLKTITTS